MTGLEKMKSQILDEAKAQAESRIAEAGQKAQSIKEEAQAQAEKEAADISQRSDKETADYRKRVASSIDLQRRTRILTAKQEVIADVLSKAYERLNQMDAVEYFEMILKMVDKYALPQEGIIYFSQADLDRMPNGYPAKIEAAAKENGGALAVSEEAKKIENGFVLVYGGMEENCTLKAIFDEKKDDLSDEINRVMFK